MIPEPQLAVHHRLARVLRAAAAARERCEVATDPSGAADEAADILRQVVELDGSYVPHEDEPMFDPPRSFEEVFLEDLKAAAEQRRERLRDERQRWGLVVILALSTGMALGTIAAEAHVTFAHWLVTCVIAFAFLWSLNTRTR